jgi:hypothetical protein
LVIFSPISTVALSWNALGKSVRMHQVRLRIRIAKLRFLDLNRVVLGEGTAARNLIEELIQLRNIPCSCTTLQREYNFHTRERKVLTV